MFEWVTKIWWGRKGQEHTSIWKQVANIYVVNKKVVNYNKNILAAKYNLKKGFRYGCKSNSHKY